jgi:mono/diheme cytochrome c family protein
MASTDVDRFICHIAPVERSSAQRLVWRTLRAIVIFGMVLSAAGAAATAVAAEHMTPFERAVRTPKGQLKSPYPDFANVAQEGYRRYMAAGCNGCHGGQGGGGMASPLTNPVWIYGDDDDTLLRVIALGTGSLSPDDAFGKLGYRRKGSEAVVGPMPDFGEIVETDADLWKIIAWMRSINGKRRATGC